ncbi:MAG TPA: sigma-70 family RNA polymerase sigma factor [Prolixibacteraceae bacterium]|nr:sigma-70 family RNA polymerase sigma factor [Prolixibacteraceae bacterium]
MNQTRSDDELWEDFRKGKKYALSHIYYLYVEKLFRYGKKFSTDDELIKDTIQDLFFDLILSREKLGTTDHIYFYLIKAFRRKLFLSLNGTKKMKQMDEAAEMQLANIVYSAEEDWIRKEQLTKKDEMVQKGLAELSPKQREILYYRYTCDFEYNQICEIMTMKYDSARKMVFRALQSLRENLSETNLSLFILHIQHIKSFRKNI